MTRKLMHALRRVSEHPMVRLAVGLLLLVSGINESVSTFTGEFDFHAHHGVVLFALLHLAKTLPEVFDGVELIGKADDFS
ncbi:MAG TPA: hypothetical protein VFY12_07665 [Arenimonas sp.]|nr:hypothetical protein [Arenimonas sp.]